MEAQLCPAHKRVEAEWRWVRLSKRWADWRGHGDGDGRGSGRIYIPQADLIRKRVLRSVIEGGQ
jgi:hypothetical protein